MQAITTVGLDVAKAESQVHASMRRERSSSPSAEAPCRARLATAQAASWRLTPACLVQRSSELQMAVHGTSRRFGASHQFDSSWGESGHVTDMAGSTRLTQTGNPSR